MPVFMLWLSFVWSSDGIHSYTFAWCDTSLRDSCYGTWPIQATTPKPSGEETVCLLSFFIVLCVIDPSFLLCKSNTEKSLQMSARPVTFITLYVTWMAMLSAQSGWLDVSRLTICLSPAFTKFQQNVWVRRNTMLAVYPSALAEAEECPQTLGWLGRCLPMLNIQICWTSS